MKNKTNVSIRRVLTFVGIIFLYGCNPSGVDTPANTVSSEPVADFDDGGETIEILTTLISGMEKVPLQMRFYALLNVKQATSGFNLVATTLIDGIVLLKHCLPKI